MSIDPGKLRERVLIKAPTLKNAVVAYEPRQWTWAEATLAGSNIFASSGLSVRGCEFVIRRRCFEPQWSLYWKGRDWFVTDIQELDRLWLKVSTAGAPLVTATLKRNTEMTEANITRQVLGPLLTAQVWLTEKYMGHDQTSGPATATATLVVVTCKAVEAKPGDVMVINGDSYAVTLCHALDETKNEYEIVKRGDT